MNLTRSESAALAKGIADGVTSDAVEVGLAPPSLYLDAVVAATQGSKVGVSAQNLYHEPKGAFTGEISAAMVKDIGCKYVILGHSERRHILGETNQDVNKKLVAALEAGLTPIVCVGELLEQRESGQTASVIQEQFDGSFAGISADDMVKCVVAYEPVWAIGTGKVASPEQAEQVHADLRKLIEQRYNVGTSESVRVLYGGSVKAENASELMAQPNIDGALVGGASLKVDGFLGIIQATA